MFVDFRTCGFSIPLSTSSNDTRGFTSFPTRNKFGSSLPAYNLLPVELFPVPRLYHMDAFRWIINCGGGLSVENELRYFSFFYFYSRKDKEKRSEHHFQNVLYRPESSRGDAARVPGFVPTLSSAVRPGAFIKFSRRGIKK